MCGSTGSICRLAKCGKLRGRRKRGRFDSDAFITVTTTRHWDICISHSQTVAGHRIGQPCQNLQYTSRKSWKVAAWPERLEAGWGCRRLSVSAGSWKAFIHPSQTPPRFQTHLVFCQDSTDPGSTIHLCGRRLCDWLSPLHNVCPSRVYHIDTNPSSASDGTPDFSKAFTVRVFLLLQAHLLSNIGHSHFKVILIVFSLLLYI